MSIAVFWMDLNFGPQAKEFSDTELTPVLKYCEGLRQAGFKHVVISSELENSVGLPGVNTVADGKTPDGEVYEWSKKHRGAGPSTP